MSIISFQFPPSKKIGLFVHYLAYGCYYQWLDGWVITCLEGIEQLLLVSSC